jgi:hypothetical protein
MAIDLEKLEYYRKLPVAYSLQELYDWGDHSETVRFSGTSQLWTWMGGEGGQFEHTSNIPAEYYAIMVGDAKDPGEDEGGDTETDTKPPDFPPTGPVFTPLDPAGIAQRNYSKYYPEYTEAPTVRAASPYPTMGLLSDPYGGADVDLYQPWSHKYGANVAPSSLWNYEPPSGLDVGPGPKVGYVK